MACGYAFGLFRLGIGPAGIEPESRPAPRADGWIRKNCGWSAEQLSLGWLVSWALDDGLSDLERAGFNEEQRRRG